MEIYTSGEYNQADLTQVLLDNKILCNIYPMQSVIYDKANDQYKVEQGNRVTVFSIENEAVLALWENMHEKLGIHCIWMDTDDFHGCICQWPWYLQHCASHGIAPLDCSEYD